MTPQKSLKKSKNNFTGYGIILIFSYNNDPVYKHSSFFANIASYKHFLRSPFFLYPLIHDTNYIEHLLQRSLIKYFPIAQHIYIKKILLISRK